MTCDDCDAYGGGDMRQGMIRRARGANWQNALILRSPLLFGLLFALGALVVYLAVQAAKLTAAILIVMFIAGFLATGLNRAVVALQRRRFSRRWAVLTVILAILAIAVFALGAFVPIVVDQVSDLINAVSGYLDQLQGTSAGQELEEKFHLVSTLKKALTPARLESLASGLVGGVAAVFGALFMVVTVAILTLYFLTGYERLTETAFRIVSRSKRARVAALGDAILDKVGGYLVGAVLVAVCAGLTAYVFMLIVGVPYPAALALIVTFLDLIPQIGATLGATVVSLIALTVSLPLAIGCVVFFTLYQQIENWFIYPRVMNRVVRVSALAAVLSVLIGGALGGVLGVLVAVPAFASIQLIVREVLLPQQDRK